MMMPYNEENPVCFVCGKSISEDERPPILLWNESKTWMEAICHYDMGIQMKNNATKN